MTTPETTVEMDLPSLMGLLATSGLVAIAGHTGLLVAVRPFWSDGYLVEFDDPDGENFTVRVRVTTPAPVDADTYLVPVLFSRSLADDLEIAGATSPGADAVAALQRQLVVELQQACDQGMAGMFEVGTPVLPLRFIHLLPGRPR